MKYYIAYGSNLNKRQMRLRCPDARPVATAELKNMTMVFRSNARGCGVATVEPQRGGRVPVGIWAISPRDEKALDLYEGFPMLYTKRTVKLNLDGAKIEAMIYIMTPGHRKTWPSIGYENTIAEGYRDFGFDLTRLADFITEGGED